MAKTGAPSSNDNATSGLRSDTAGKKRRRLLADERRGEILEAARTIFVRDGLKGARMRDISTEAGANIATIFYYFESKDELFDAAVLQPLDAYAVDLQASSEKFMAANDPEDRRRLSAEAHKIKFEMMTKEFPLLAAALFATQERGSEFYRTKLYPRLQALAELTDSTEPHLKKSGIDPMLLSFGSFALHFMFAMDAHYRDIKADPETVGNDIDRVITASEKLARIEQKEAASSNRKSRIPGSPGNRPKKIGN